MPTGVTLLIFFLLLCYLLTAAGITTLVGLFMEHRWRRTGVIAGTLATALITYTIALYVQFLEACRERFISDQDGLASVLLDAGDKGPESLFITLRFPWLAGLGFWMVTCLITVAIAWLQEDSLQNRLKNSSKNPPDEPDEENGLSAATRTSDKASIQKTDEL